MPFSMTGFGRAEVVNDRYHIQVDIKSVNNRYNDVLIKMPWQLKPYEDAFRKYTKEKLKRGRIEIYVKVERTQNQQANVKVDMGLATAYYHSLKALSDKFSLQEDKMLELIARFPEVLKQEEEEEDEEALFQQTFTVFQEASEKILLMRKTEGEELKNDILERGKLIETMTQKIEVQMPHLVNDYREKLEQRIQELLEGKVELDEAKLINEVAYFADRTNISEELVRMKSHIFQLKNILENEESVGRKLDFLVQEMNREANTM